MDATLSVRDNPAGGALFVFEAPLFRVPVPEALPVDPCPAPSESRALHVLIVDDKATNRQVAATLCEMFGCTSDEVTDGHEAVQAAAIGCHDVIVMDIKLPGMDGTEATRRIRSGAGCCSAVPIIAVTANAHPTDEVFYLASGMNGVVETPLKPERLLAVMSAVLRMDEPEDEVCAA